MRVVVIGAGGAGITAAIEAKRNNGDAEVIIVDKRKRIGFAPCALPYVLAGDIKSFDDIIEFPKNFIEEQGIKLLLEKTVIGINRSDKKVILDDNQELNYDSLILAVGSHSFIPPIKGVEGAELFTLKTIEDAEKLKARIDELKTKENPKAVVIGAGFIGLEMAFALAKNNINVSVIEVAPYILPVMLDEDFAKIVKEKIESDKLRIFCSEKVNSIEKNLVITDKSKYEFDLLVLATGVRANSDIAKNAGLEVNKGIVVNEFMQTSDKNIYACGDCIEINNIVLNKKNPSQLATTALRTGKIAGYNAVSNEKKSLKGVLNTAVTKIMGLTIASTGLTEFSATKNNIEFVKATISSKTREDYATKKNELIAKLIINKEKRIIGSQIIGDDEVVPMIDLLALAIKSGLSADELVMMEHAYSPLTSPVRSQISILAELCLKKLGVKKK